jgi:hypothetical protein
LACVSTPQYPGPPPYPGSQNPNAYNPYNPYGSPYPAAPGPEPVRRPGLMVVALVLMILAALPFLLLGAVFLLAPLNAGNIPPEILSSPRLQQAGATADLIITAMRIFGGVMLASAVIYLLFGILAFVGRNWARILIAVLTVGFALLLVAGLVASGGAVDTISVSGILLVLILGAVAILFSPGANAWYAYRR